MTSRPTPLPAGWRYGAVITLHALDVAFYGLFLGSVWAHLWPPALSWTVALWYAPAWTAATGLLMLVTDGPGTARLRRFVPHLLVGACLAALSAANLDLGVDRPGAVHYLDVGGMALLFVGVFQLDINLGRRLVATPVPMLFGLVTRLALGVAPRR